MSTAKKAPVPTWKVAVIGFSFMSIGLTIGLSPAYAVQLAGSGAAASQALGLIAMLAVAVAVSAFARRHVVSGSLMSYVYFAFGRWGRALVGGFQLCGYFAMAASITAATQIFMVGVLGDLGVASDSIGVQALSVILLIGGACYFTCRGIEASVRLSLILAAIAIPAVSIVAVAAAMRYGLNFSAQFDVAKISLKAVIQGAMATLAFLIGFEGLTTLAADTADPKRSIPRLLYLLLGVVGACAVVATLIEAPLLIEHRAAIDAGVSPIDLLSSIAGMPWMRLPSDVLMVATGFAAMTAAYTFAARIVAAVSADGILPSWLSHVDAQGGAPRRAAVLVSAATVVALVLPTLVAKVSPVALGSVYGSALVTFWLVPYVLICLAAIVQEFKGSKADPKIVLGSAVGGTVTIFMLFRTVTDQADATLAWIPWAVVATAIPLALWFFSRSIKVKISDF